MDNINSTLTALNYFLSLVGPFAILFVTKSIRNITEKKLVKITANHNKSK